MVPPIHVFRAHAVSAARHLSDRLTESEVTTLEHIADLAVGGGVSQDGRAKVRRSDNVDSGTLQGDDAKLTITVKNELGTDVYVGWQTPDHSSMRREQGMHVAPDLIAAGRTQTINTFHRHGFYFWDAVEGDAAPLHREGVSCLFFPSFFFGARSLQLRCAKVFPGTRWSHCVGRGLREDLR